MALRVLLADESVTIKRVFQLALQDYGVDVLTVNVGLDVSSVAKKFNPDIIFADVLLQKKNGYQVSEELKKDPELKIIPIVLIWSGFMDFDEGKFKSSLANAHLEKPFDTKKLRQLVQNLVPKTQTQNISQFLNFPDMPDFDEGASKNSEPAKPTKAPPPASSTEIELDLSMDDRPETPDSSPSIHPSQPPAPEFTKSSFDMYGEFSSQTSSNHKFDLKNESSDQPREDSSPDAKEWSMENFEPLGLPTDVEEEGDEFVPVELKHKQPKKMPEDPPPLDLEIEEEESDPSQWIQKPITKSKYRVDVGSGGDPSDDEPQVSYQVPEEKIDIDTVLTNQIEASTPSKDHSSADEEDIELDLSNEPEASSLAPQLDEKQLEAIIRAQSKEVIEKVIWQVLPEIATQIIEREIQKLLKEKNELRPR